MSRYKEEMRVDNFFDNYGNRILLSLRRIASAVDAYSRKLAAEHNITGPQLMCLYSIVKNGPLTLSMLSKRYSLSPSTVTGIIDRLESKGFATRARSDPDRRKVLITATDAGSALVSKAPSPLQDKLIAAIKGLPEAEQGAITNSLERIVDLMQVGSTGARPNRGKESATHQKGS